MKKEVKIYFAICLVLLSLSFVNAQHSASEIQISVSGSSMTLQSAINGGYFKLAGYTYTSPATVSGHVPTQIWVSVKNGEMTLENALKSSGKLCPTSPVKTSYTSSSIPNPSHLATEIILSSGKTFQKAIDDGDYCCVPETCASSGLNCGSNYLDGCGGTFSCGTCPTGQECTYRGTCVSVVTTCVVTTTCENKICGSITTNCGTTLNCGTCIYGTCTNEGTFCNAPDIYLGKITVICSELHRQGLMSDEIYFADEKFGEQLSEEHPEILKGYTLFATPIVEKMQESEEFTQIINEIAKPWTEEMAYRVGAREKGNFIGAMMMNVGMVIFWITGSLAIGQIGILFLTQITIALFIVSLIYLNKPKK
jgi:hypothetical protein